MMTTTTVDTLDEKVGARAARLEARRASRKTAVTVAAALLGPGCGAPPASPAPPAPTAVSTGIESAPPPTDPWLAQAVSLKGLEQDTGRCSVTRDTAAFEAWARAFRMPRKEAPSKGAELPRVELEPVAVDGSPPAGAQAYLQRARYVLAGAVVHRRFVMQSRDDGTVVGCVVDERVEREESPLAPSESPWRWERPSKELWELTNVPKPETGKTVARVLAGAGVRHACSIVDGQLSCLSGGATARIEVRGARWAFARLVAFVPNVPYLVPRRPGRSLTHGDFARQYGMGSPPIRGRALHDKGASTAPSPVAARIDGSGLPPFEDRGACFSMELALPMAKADEWDDEGSSELHIEARLPFLWADSFDPEGPHGGAQSQVGAWLEGYPVVAFTAATGGLGMVTQKRKETDFVFVSEPTGIAGCAVYSGPGRMKPVANSFTRTGDGFRYRLRQATSAMGMLSADVETERHVQCRYEARRLGCVSVPLRWRHSDAEITSALPGASPKPDANRPREAEVHPTSDGLRWSFEGRVHRLVIRHGQSTFVPHPSQSMQPGPIEARATLVR